VVVFDVAFFKASSSSSLSLPPLRFAARAPEQRGEQRRLIANNDNIFSLSASALWGGFFCNEHFQKEEREKSSQFAPFHANTHAHARALIKT